MNLRLIAGQELDEPGAPAIWKQDDFKALTTMAFGGAKASLPDARSPTINTGQSLLRVISANSRDQRGEKGKGPAKKNLVPHGTGKKPRRAHVPSTSDGHCRAMRQGGHHGPLASELADVRAAQSSTRCDVRLPRAAKFYWCVPFRNASYEACIHAVPFYISSGTELKACNFGKGAQAPTAGVDCEGRDMAAAMLQADPPQEQVDAFALVTRVEAVRVTMCRILVEIQRTGVVPELDILCVLASGCRVAPWFMLVQHSLRFHAPTRDGASSRAGLHSAR